MDTSTIRVGLSDDQANRFDGLVEKVWFGRDGAAMSITFGLREGPCLSLGRAAQVCLEGGPFEQEVQVACLVIGRTESDHDLYELRFGDAAYPVIGELFETRRDPRVAPAEGPPITVALRSLDTSAKALAAELIDISLGGAGLSIPPSQERDLATFERVRVALPLPGLAQPVVFDADIRHRTLNDERLIYGIQFDPGSEGDPRYVQLSSYVDSRLDELRASGSHQILPKEKR